MPWPTGKLIPRLIRALRRRDDRSQPMKLPLEIIYKIADEVYNNACDNVMGTRNPLKSLSQTCRALAAHCRLLTLRSVVIHSSSPSAPYLRSPAVPAGTVKAFTKLVARDPQLSNAVLDLHLDMRAKRRSRIRYPPFPKHKWLLLFRGDFCRLKYLKLSFSPYDLHRVDIVKEMMQFILHAKALESLSLKIAGSLAISALECVPENVKDLTIDLWGRLTHGSWMGHQSTTSKLAGPPRLKSLTMVWGDVATEIVARHSNGQTFPIDLSNLFHLQLSSPLDLSTYEEFSCALILLSADHLRCIHIDDPWRYQADSNNPPQFLRLDRYSLPNLQCVEICTREWKRDLERVLTWLSSSVITPTSTLHIKVLKVSVLTPCRRQDVIGQFVLWEEMCQEDRWPNLRLGRVSAYAAFDACGFPGNGFGEVVPLGVYGGGQAEEYQSLWEGCPCSGWRTG